MSVGLFTFAITFAMVKVLPEPVTPRSTWCFRPDYPFRQLLDRLGLVAFRDEVRYQLELAHDCLTSSSKFYYMEVGKSIFASLVFY